MTASYTLTTPVRDEITMLPRLVAMVEALNPRPVLWLVVDDGSQDGSRAWLEAAASARPWLDVVSAPEAATEYLGGHIARLKRWGLETALVRCDERSLTVAFAGILDADMELPADHYARLLQAMAADPTLGVASSLLQEPSDTGLRREAFQRSDLPRGPTQFFRRTCLDAIGGLPPWPGYDGAANVKAQLAGWRTRIIMDVVAIHHRPTATRFGHASGFERKGRYAWFLGVHPLLVAARGAAYCAERPHAAGLYFLKGWLGEALRSTPRCPDPAVRQANGWPRVASAVRAALGREQHYAGRG